jgi:co-chaperonin GroES (HSP10)
MINAKENVGSVRPLRDYVKVKVELPKEIKTTSGIVLANSTKLSEYFTDIEIYEGEVLELSPNAEKKCNGFFKVGDKVIFDRLSEVTISTEGDDFIKLVEVGMLILKNSGEFAEFNIDSFKPYKDRVIVEVEPFSNMTKGGIIIPDTAKRDSVLDRSLRKGIIKSVSDDVDEVVAGDKVIFHDACGVPISVGKKEYRVLVRYDLVATITE